MTFIVGEACINCKHTDCVEVCPVDCFYEGPNFLVIHPDECIDCACVNPSVRWMQFTLKMKFRKVRKSLRN